MRSVILLTSVFAGGIAVGLLIAYGRADFAVLATLPAAWLGAFLLGPTPPRDS